MSRSVLEKLQVCPMEYCQLYQLLLMNRLYLFLLFGFLAFGVQAKGRLNVILIMADDSHADNYGCYGSKFFSTPNLDQLARTGVKFNHCYSEPVCTSSRVKIMTGRDGIRNYVQFGTLD